MNVQVLVASMNQSDYSLLEKMNISSDVIVGNQCDRNTIEKFEYKGYSATYLNFEERGVGLNRNNALMRADGDICLFADDDMVYYDDYVDIIEKAFVENEKADVIIFNIVGRDAKGVKIDKKKRINRFNYLRYGTARVAVRTNKIKENSIYFNQCFGGGTNRCHGEDNLFLTACLDRGLKIYAVPDYIATLTDERESTWNKGYDEKYLLDQGCLYCHISRYFWRALCLQDAIRHYKLYKKSFWKVYSIMCSGAKKW